MLKFCAVLLYVVWDGLLFSAPEYFWCITALMGKYSKQNPKR